MCFHDIRSAFLPYCIQQVEPGWHVILNREYKPIGHMTTEIGQYERHMIRIGGLTPEMAKRLSVDGNPDVTAIFLYHDGCIPTGSPLAEQAYYERLALLSRLKIDTKD